MGELYLLILSKIKKKILGTIPSYASGIVPIGACNQSWCNIRFINITGWVRTKYLAAQKS
jgi:uncharacterized protein YraI